MAKDLKTFVVTTRATREATRGKRQYRIKAERLNFFGNGGEDSVLMLENGTQGNPQHVAAFPVKMVFSIIQEGTEGAEGA